MRVNIQYNTIQYNTIQYNTDVNVAGCTFTLGDVSKLPNFLSMMNCHLDNKLKSRQIETLKLTVKEHTEVRINFLHKIDPNLFWI